VRTSTAFSIVFKSIIWFWLPLMSERIDKGERTRWGITRLRYIDSLLALSSASSSSIQTSLILHVKCWWNLVLFQHSFLLGSGRAAAGERPRGWDQYFFLPLYSVEPLCLGLAWPSSSSELEASGFRKYDMRRNGWSLSSTTRFLQSHFLSFCLFFPKNFSGEPY